MEYAKDIIAALAVILNCLPSALLAMSMGFSSLATALGFASGGIALLLSGQIAAVSFQPEALLLLSRLSDEREERLTIAIGSSCLMLLLGATKMLTRIVAFIGDGVICSLLAGMGIMVCRVALDMLAKNKLIGTISIVSAVIVYWITADLVYTVAVSCVVSVIFYRLTKAKSETPVDLKETKLQLMKPKFSARAIKGIFSLTALQLAAVIAYSSVNNSLAGVDKSLAGVASYLGITGIISTSLSGAPLAPIISATSSAPHPLLSGMVFMLLMAVMLFADIMPKLTKHIPQQAICGFLFVLGALVIFPGNAQQAIEFSSIAAGLTIAVSAFADPFLGIATGTVVFKLVQLL